jgi:hypothetical protein
MNILYFFGSSHSSHFFHQTVHVLKRVGEEEEYIKEGVSGHVVKRTLERTLRADQ